MTCGWVNYHNILILKWNTPSYSFHFFRLVRCDKIKIPFILPGVMTIVANKTDIKTSVSKGSSPVTFVHSLVQKAWRREKIFRVKSPVREMMRVCHPQRWREEIASMPNSILPLPFTCYWYHYWQTVTEEFYTSVRVPLGPPCALGGARAHRQENTAEPEA